MVTAKRADYFGLYYMLESSYGVDPGIVAASLVDGSTETYKYVPTTALKSWVKMAEKPTGLPKLPLVEVPTVFATHEYDPCRLRGIQDTGEFSISLVLHGAVVDDYTAPSRTCPPPWLHLAASACGLLKGLSGAGGAPDTIATATDSDTFTVTTGTLDEGMVIAVDGPGASTDLEIVRLSNLASATSITDIVYGGVKFGLTATPVAAEVVYYATQAAFDKRFEGVSESFTFLLQRADSEASMVIAGARCSSWEITSRVGEIPMVKLSFIYKSFTYTTDVLDDEPGYIEDYPCPAVTQGAKCWITSDMNSNSTVDATDRNTAMEVASFSAKWTAGYARRKASTASTGIAEIVCSQASSFEISIETVYDQDFQDVVGLCCSEPFANLCLYYWEPNNDFVRDSATTTRKGAWFVVAPSIHLKEDPGSEDEIDAMMHQKLVFACGNYTDDGDTAGGGAGTGVFATTAHTNTKFAIGVV